MILLLMEAINLVNNIDVILKTVQLVKIFYHIVLCGLMTT